MLASSSNITVDDVGPNIEYIPPNVWMISNSCDVCTAHPDTTKAGNGTWHDSTHEAGDNVVPSASMHFNGSAVYVFCIIAHSSEYPTGNSDMTFFLDEWQVGTFVRPPTGQDKSYDYNVLVYANESMSPGQHTIWIRNGTPGGPKSLILLDYIVYTTGGSEAGPFGSLGPISQGPTTASQRPASSSSNTDLAAAATSERKIVIAAVVPSVVALLLAIGVLVSCTRRRQKPRNYRAPPLSVTAHREARSGWAQNLLSLRGQRGDTQTMASPFTSTTVSAAPFGVGGASKSNPSAASRSLPTQSMTSSALLSTQAQRGSTLINYNMPPAYEDISHYDI